MDAPLDVNLCLCLLRERHNLLSTRTLDPVLARQELIKLVPIPVRSYA